MKRQQIQTRDSFNDDERQHIAAKSDGYCAHCGKRIEFGGQATVDHFVPLSKGGVNADYNMVMLCHSCNSEKGNSIIAPDGYLLFLHEKDLNKLADYYYNSYIKAFDYLTTHHVLASDMIYIQCFVGHKRSPITITKNKHSKSFRTPGFTVILRRAQTQAEITKIKDFWKKYLNKMGVEGHENDIDYYMASGTIYYLEQVDGIKIIFPVVFSQLDPRTVGPQIFVHALYTNDRTTAIVVHSIDIIASVFLEEQEFKISPVAVTTFTNDSIKKVLALHYFHKRLRSDTYLSSYYFAVLGKFEEIDNSQIYDHINHAINFMEKYVPDKERVERICKDDTGGQSLMRLIFAKEYCHIRHSTAIEDATVELRKRLKLDEPGQNGQVNDTSIESSQND